MKPVIITTEHKGVFFGYSDDTSGDTIVLKNARMAIYWGTTKGLFQLAETGPTEKSTISALAEEIEVRKVTAVIKVSAKAEKAWNNVK